MNHSQSLQRRAFLKKLTLGVGATSLLAAQGKLQLMQSAIAASSDYSSLTDHKSLVCVFLYGGNDAFNMLVPYEQAAYSQYKTARSRIALPRNRLKRLKGNQHAFHPSMGKLQALYNSDKLAVAASIGALIQPTDRASYQNKSVPLPSDLFSHNHQQEFWGTGTTAKSSVHPPGWGGRMMDMLITANTNPTEPALFSLAGNSVWQRGLDPLDFVLNTDSGVEGIKALKNKTWPRWRASRIEAWDKILNTNKSGLLEQHMAKTYVNADEHISELVNEIANSQKITTIFPKGNDLAKQLKMAAKMISIRENLGMKRQIFFVAMSGWDSHGKQLTNHANNLKKLDGAMDAFYKTTVELNVEDSVTTFTASEFGRSYTPSNGGTDHAWAGHNLVMGGAVKGGKIHGELLDLTVGGKDDATDTGRFIPKYGVDQYGATLAKWMGMSDSDMLEIFPNLSNFNTNDLGFMV